MDEELFQDIFDVLQDVLPDKWSKLVFYAAYFEGSYSMKYYIDNGTGQYQDCFSLFSRKDLIKKFMELDKIIIASRKKLSDKDMWTCLTMIVEENGDFCTKFDYNTIVDPIKYEQIWKKKVLGKAYEESVRW